MNAIIQNSNTYDMVYEAPKIENNDTDENSVDEPITIKEIIKMMSAPGNLTVRLFGYECIGLYKEISHIDIIVDTVNYIVLITANCYDDDVICGVLKSEYLDSTYYALSWHATLVIQIKKGISTYIGKINELYNTYVHAKIDLYSETQTGKHPVGIENRCSSKYNKRRYKKRRVVQ
jgi:hypothetical protein